MNNRQMLQFESTQNWKMEENIFNAGWNLAVVKIVECQECKYADTDSLEPHIYCTNKRYDNDGFDDQGIMIYVESDHFCGYGECNDY